MAFVGGKSKKAKKTKKTKKLSEKKTPIWANGKS